MSIRKKSGNVSHSVDSGAESIRSRAIVRVAGGLGNQLFQFALAYSWARRNKREVVLDASLYSRYPSHDGFVIDDLVTLAQNLTDTNLSVIHRPRTWDAWYKIMSLLPKRFVRFSNWQLVRERNPFVFQDLPAESVNQILLGYWQSWKYFEPDVLSLVALISRWLDVDTRRKELDVLLNSSPSRPKVMIHVRRGDYARLQNLYGLLGKSYYSRAINLVTSTVTDPLLVVFSDDLDRVKEEGFLPTSNVEYFDDTGMSSRDVLGYMASCSHFVTGNSTFSWWAAFLGRKFNSESLVICPDVWLAGLGANPDLIPPEWQAIPRYIDAPFDKQSGL